MLPEDSLATRDEEKKGKIMKNLSRIMVLLGVLILVLATFVWAQPAGPGPGMGGRGPGGGMGP